MEMKKKLFGPDEPDLPGVQYEKLLQQAERLAGRSGMAVRIERTGEAGLCLFLEGPLFVAADPEERLVFQQLFALSQQFDVMSYKDLVRLTFYYDLRE